jgi:prepilin-type N-terminal cleavage/methylation domain-containing protein
MKNKLLQTNKGFTLIELLIVGAIVVLIASFVIGSLSNYRNEQTLRTESLAVVSIINEARSKTLASFESSVYGVHLEDDSVTLFQGATYSLGDTDNEVHSLPNNLEIGNITISGGDDIIFERLTGDTSNTGGFDLMLTTDNTKSRTISIIANGQINLN